MDNNGSVPRHKRQLVDFELGGRQITLGEAVAAAVLARTLAPYGVLLAGSTVLQILDELEVCTACGYPLDHVRNLDEPVRAVHNCRSYAQSYAQGIDQA